MANLREKLNNNPQYVTIGTIVIIAVAIFFIYLQLRRPSAPKPDNSVTPAQTDGRRTMRPNPNDQQPPAEGQAEQEQPAEQPQQ